MSEIHAAIQSLERELEATQQRCHLIERALGGLREIYGEPSTNGAATKKASRNGRTDGRTDGRTEQKARRRAARSLPDDCDHTSHIVAAVRQAGGVMKRGDLMKALGTSLYHLKQWLPIALKAKAVVATGTKVSYRISLPGRPAKEAP
jgi:hypothetical protein